MEHVSAVALYVAAPSTLLHDSEKRWGKKNRKSIEVGCHHLGPLTLALLALDQFMSAWPPFPPAEGIGKDSSWEPGKAWVQHPGCH